VKKHFESLDKGRL